MTVAVAHVMKTNVFFAAPDDTVDHVRELMSAKHIHEALRLVTKSCGKGFVNKYYLLVLLFVTDPFYLWALTSAYGQILNLFDSIVKIHRTH